MAEMGNDEDGGGGTVDDWRELLSSPRGNLFSGFVADGYASAKSFSQISNDFDVSTISIDDGGGGGVFGGSEGAGLDAMMEGTNNWKPPDTRNGASIAERRGVRCGFNAPRLNTARFRNTSPLSSPQYLTIPPGLSPTSLLDSPVMLSNSQAQPSPTTGTFSLPSQSTEAIQSSTLNMDKDKNDDLHSSFMFKPFGDVMSLSYLSSTENQVSSASDLIQAVEMGDTNHQMATQVKFESQSELLNQSVTVEGVASAAVDSNCVPLQSYDPDAVSLQAPPPEQSRANAESQQLLEGDKRGGYPLVATGRPSEDGYNWRKYGQKQVKGSEYPRSYYKCTHQNCQVKKKIERSHDGQITEIIYKGGHNHPQPQPSRRSAVGSPYSVGEMWETGEDSGSFVKVEGGSAWRSTHQGSMDNGQERTSSTSAVTEASDHLSTAQEKHMGTLDSADTPELSSTLASHDDEEDRATQGSISLGDEADDDESESKRRKKDSCIMETSMASRAIREPRVVVQTHSEVDILDDGYRWRKYGQKVVKGNPNPRSYYKCTSAGCTVRKHVERASHDLKYVITTYEGKHNHEVPAARNSGHMNATCGNAPPATSNGQASLAPPRGTNTAKPEAQVQDLVPRFERKPNFSNEFLRSTNLRRFASDMKLQPFQTSIPCGAFGLNAPYNGGHQAAHIAPEFAMSMPMNVPMYGYNSFGNAVVPQSFVGNQQMNDTDMRLVRPKQEQKDESVFGPQLPINHLQNASASMLQQMMGGFPVPNLGQGDMNS